MRKGKLVDRCIQDENLSWHYTSMCLKSMFSFFTILYAFLPSESFRHWTVLNITVQPFNLPGSLLPLSLLPSTALSVYACLLPPLTCQSHNSTYATPANCPAGPPSSPAHGVWPKGSARQNDRLPSLPLSPHHTDRKALPWPNVWQQETALPKSLKASKTRAL